MDEYLECALQTLKDIKTNKEFYNYLYAFTRYGMSVIEGLDFGTKYWYVQNGKNFGIKVIVNEIKKPGCIYLRLLGPTNNKKNAINFFEENKIIGSMLLYDPDTFGEIISDRT